MCGGPIGGGGTPDVRPPPVITQPQIIRKESSKPKTAKGRRRTQDSATFARGVAARLYPTQGTLMTQDESTGKTILGT